jgi:hypothetical protein
LRTTQIKNTLAVTNPNLRLNASSPVLTGED